MEEDGFSYLKCACCSASEKVFDSGNDCEAMIPTNGEFKDLI